MKLFAKTDDPKNDIPRLSKGDMMLYAISDGQAIIIQLDKANKVFVAGRHDPIEKPKTTKDEYQETSVSFNGQHYTELPFEGVCFARTIKEVLETTKEIIK